MALFGGETADRTRASKRMQYIHSIIRGTEVQFGRPSVGGLCPEESIIAMIHSFIRVICTSPVVNISTRMHGLMSKRQHIIFRFRAKDHPSIRNRQNLADGIGKINRPGTRQYWEAVLAHTDRIGTEADVEDDIFQLVLNTILLASGKVVKRQVHGVLSYVNKQTKEHIPVIEAPSRVVLDDIEMGLLLSTVGVF